MRNWLVLTIVIVISSCATYKRVTPQMYGAKGDGVADDYRAIQAALDKGGKIYFPEGTYRVSNTLHVTKSHTHLKLHKKAVIECYERTTATKKYGNAGSTIVFNSSSFVNNPTGDGERIVDVGIEGGIVRNRTPAIQQFPPFNNENAICFTHCHNFYCRNVSIEFCNRKGITMQYYNDYGVIEGCIIKDCGVHGITVESSSNHIVIRNNKVIMNKKALSKGKNTGNGRNYALHVIESHDIKVSNNNICSDCGVGVYSNDCEDVSIQKNNINSSIERSIVLSSKAGGSSTYILKGNTLKGQNYCIYLSGLSTNSNFVVEDNVCESGIKFSKGIVKLRRNVATFCTIDQPMEPPQIYQNKFQYVNVINASDQTRPLSKGNVLEKGYSNWSPK